MIDTDKYEGHTPAPWRVKGELTEGDDNMGQSGDSTLSIHGDGLYIGEVGADYGIHETIANAQLIADAPLLLAEVKRLRVIEERHRRMANVLSDYCIEDVCDEFFEGDYSFYERLVKAYRWKEGDEE
jgi:hypothetical protein|tara:strand:- start:222 stop:602 length:381 start_codon:yes stop_codon:yes gene_type:complete